MPSLSCWEHPQRPQVCSKLCTVNLTSSRTPFGSTMPSSLLLIPRPNRSVFAAAIVRMVIPVMILSAFMNNTPIVALMIPILTSWARKAGLAPGHLLMPLSFASILGGTVTLIGTSTNLVVAGKQKDTFPDDKPIGLFDLSPYGVPVAIMGIIYIIVFAPRLLPGKAKKRSSE